MNDLHRPALNAVLAELAAVLPLGVGVAVVIVRGADAEGFRQCHVCDRDMDADAFEVAADCLKQMGETDGKAPAGARLI